MNFRHFLELLARYRQRYGFALYRNCLMTNHFHLLLRTDRPGDLSTCVGGLIQGEAARRNDGVPMRPAPSADGISP